MGKNDYCCVINCNNGRIKAKRAGEHIIFSSFPLGKNAKSSKRRLLWLQAIRRDNFVPNRSTKVCSRHFVAGFQINDPASVDFVPSLHLGYEKRILARRTANSRRTATLDIAANLGEMGRRQLSGIVAPDIGAEVTPSTESKSEGPGKGDGFVDSSQCTSFPCLVFEDNFDFINHRVWQHEITARGGGNWEFQFYTNNRTNSYTRDGILYIKPTLTSDHYGMEFLEHGSLDLWGGSVADVCTGNNFWGCKRDGAPGRVVNPIQSARLRSSRGFNFRYGKVEVEAQLPIGDWLWPGNRNYRSPQGVSVDVDSVGSTLHFGADYFTNQWPKAHAEKVLSGATYADGFHKYAVNWDDEAITFYVDDEEILRVDPGPDGFWKFSGLDQTTYDNPWKEGTRMAPFDQEFHIILNLAVGGVRYFDDKNVNSPYAKPWVDNAGSEADRFWAARSQWLPTWNLDQNNGEDAAVWKTKPDQ